MRARVKYIKGEEVKYVGHLDTMRTFIRCIKRTCIPVKYSSGFNPRVQISFALPLGVGVTSSSEYFDLEVLSKMNEDMFLGELNSTLPLGYKAISVKYIDDTDKKSLMSLVKEAIYEIDIESNYSLNQIEEIFNAPEILIEKEDKNKAKSINIKDFIIDVKVEKSVQNENIVKVIIHSTAGSSNNLNPTYVIKAIEKYIGPIEDFSIHRKELII